MEDHERRGQHWESAAPGVTIGINSVVGAGGAVTRDVPDHVLAAGNPCRVVREA